jgi:GT2 family glycosyltransferase
MIDVSIIIVNYNQFEILDNCLKSIYKYTKSVNFEIIVVDNNSSEGDVEVVTKNYNSVIVIKNKTNNRYSLANNQGIEVAKGEFILLLNNDTLFIEDTLSELVKTIKLYNEPVLLGCKLLNSDLTHQQSVVDFDTISNLIGEYFFIYKLFPKSRLFNKFHLSITAENTFKEVDVIKGALIFGRTIDFRKLNGFDTRFFFFNEENEFCYRFKQLGGKIYYNPDTSIIHLGGSTTEKMVWFKIRNHSVSKIQYFQKYFRGIRFFIAITIHYSGFALRVPLYLIGSVFTLNKNLLFKSFYYFKSLFIYPKNNFIVS